MINKIKSYFFKIAYPLVSVFWRLFKPNTVGVRVAVLNNKNEVLLVKHSYRKNYFFPGGGVLKKEKFNKAAKRELFEEIGLTLNEKDFVFRGIYQYFEEGKNDVIAFYTVKLLSDVKINVDNIEIVEATWFKLDQLPTDLSHGVKERLVELKAKSKVTCGSW